MAKPDPKKIALLLPSLKFGGAERVALNLAKTLQENGAQIDVLLMSKEGEFLAEAELNFNVVDLKCNKTYKLPAKLIFYFISRRPNVLLSSFWKLNLCACLARIAFPSIRLLLWEHSPPSKSKNSPKWLYAFTVSFLYQFSSKVVAVSTGVYNDINRWSLGLNRKLVVIFNPITPPDRRLLGKVKSDQVKQIIWVGRLDEPKNPGLLLEAFSIVQSTYDVSLLYAGDGPLREKLERRCQDLGLFERVKFIGFYPYPYELIAVSDLLVISSDREGLPSVIIEAMYCGLRVVSTDCGEGIHDILLDNRYGTIVPVEDKFALAKAIESELKIFPVPAEQMKGAERFLPQVIAQQFMATLR
jgi:glycosyltransferase involved in cell wall biosynthesis